MEELLEGLFEAGVGLGGRMALFGEEVAVVAGLIGAFAVAGHALDLCWRGVDVWGWRAEAGLGLQGDGGKREESSGKYSVTSGGRADSHEARLRVICACEGYQSVRVPSSLRAMGR